MEALYAASVPAQGAVGSGVMRESAVYRVSASPWFSAVVGMMATAELVMTIRRIVGTFRAECRMLVVPLIAGRMISFSGFSVCCFPFKHCCPISFLPQIVRGEKCQHTARGNGLATCSTNTTSFSTSSKAPSAVMSGTMKNSMGSVTNGAIKSCSRM